jgi:hypothetical protein
MLCVRRFPNISLTTTYRDHHKDIGFERQSLLELIERLSRNPGIAALVDVG